MLPEITVIFVRLNTSAFTLNAGLCGFVADGVGANVGKVVGRSVGALVGADVGASVGVLVVGVVVGAAVGLAMGALLEASVVAGAAVGVAVGLCVGGGAGAEAGATEEPLPSVVQVEVGVPPLVPATPLLLPAFGHETAVELSPSCTCARRGTT